MKLVTFVIILISFSVIQCATSKMKNCAQVSFNASEIFDTTAEKVGLRRVKYVKVEETSHCFVSFNVPLPEQQFDVERISDCSQHFRGKVEAGEYPGQLQRGLESKRCYFQHDLIICVCEKNYCNHPQYWSLMLSRFVHSRDKNKLDEIIGGKMVETLKLPGITLKKSGNITHARCFMWFADTIGQEDYDPPFYLYNYITTRYDAPPLADALTTAPRLKFKKHYQAHEKHYYVVEPEPFEDGTMELRPVRDLRQEHEPLFETIGLYGPGEMDADAIQTIGVVLLAVGLILLLGGVGGTVFIMLKFCRRLMDHSQFSRKKDTATLLRYERLYAAETVPKEFTRKKEQ